MRIATFNVNSVRARLPRILEWLQETKPEVVCLQEIKCQEHQFPFDDFKTIGYEAKIFGQKSYNGVAILSNLPITDVKLGLPGCNEDEQARFIEAKIKGIRCCSIYLPNGNPIASEKFTYKLSWMDRLIAYVENVLLPAEEPFILAGDFNVCPQAIDCFDENAIAKDAIVQPESRQRWHELCNLGLIDAFRIIYPEQPGYSYWDMFTRAWDRDDGIRIDHLLCSSQVADRLQDSGVDREPRGKEKPSDHTPVWINLK